MITKLSDAQIAQMPEYVRKWTGIGLSTAPLDVEAAKDAISRAYRQAGLPPPQEWVVCGSPLAAAIVASVWAGVQDSVEDSVQDSVEDSVRGSAWASVRVSVWDSVGDSVGDSVRDSVRDSVWASVRDSVWDSVRDSVWDSVRDSVRDSVWASVWDSVRDSVWDSVRDSVRDSVWASVRDSVRASVWASVRDSVWASVRDSVWASVRASVRAAGDSVRASVGASVMGPHDAHWLAFYDFFWREVGIEAASALGPLMDAAQAGGWWIPYKNVCFLQHRHCELHRDEAGRLHNPMGMAVKYPDGWGVYAWHGLRIPSAKAWIIEEPNRLDSSIIDAEGNAELRRVMLEIYGHDRYILESGLRPEQADETGELFRKQIPGDEDLVMVRVVNSTPEPSGEYRRYMLRVPPTVRTARQAVAWTFGLDEGDYAPIFQS